MVLKLIDKGPEVDNTADTPNPLAFKKGVYPGDLVYRQYCLLPARYQLI